MTRASLVLVRVRRNSTCPDAGVWGKGERVMTDRHIRTIVHEFGPLIVPGVPSAGDCGTLGPLVASPLMISCIDASKASTREDIWVTVGIKNRGNVVIIFNQKK